MRTLTVALLCAAALVRAEDYALGPDSQPQPNVPKGELTRYTLAPGKFYPGTPHNYAVYVPAKYDSAKPIPFMIFLDGNGATGGLRVPVVFDNLIAKGELPPMVGIFINPGVLPALSDNAQSRYERIFEYDSTSGRFAQFLLEEVIPEVSKKYNLSKDPNDRALAGVSTGAVGAFVAAWNRPDQFHRVLSLIGTFVDMKGAEELASQIRKNEPKPIRILLQDGKNDHLAPGQPYGTFFAGSWPINNQIIFEAFEFAGYDARLVLGDGGHDTRQGAAMMPDALRWLWRDYPKPITVHEPPSMTMAGYDPRGRVYSIVSADKGWEQVGDVYRSVASPTSDKEGNVYFADPAEGRIYKQGVDGKVVVFRDNTGGAKALRAGADGRLYAVQGSRVVSFGAGGDLKLVAQGVDAGDLAVTQGGGIYFTDTQHRTIGYIDSKGIKRVAYKGGEISAPAGLSLSPDQAMLVVSDSQTRYGWSFQIAKDGSLVNGEPFYRLYVPELAHGSTIQGVTIDTSGQVYFAGALGIQVTEQNGRSAAILNPPEFGTVDSVTFAGKDMDWLYVTEGTKVFRRKTKVKGAPVWAPVKPPQPPL